jgi:hypothetical protein
LTRLLLLLLLLLLLWLCQQQLKMPMLLHLDSFTVRKLS